MTVGTRNAQLGLPELTLGIIPGFGGTQRLPRLVGVKMAIEMMLTSKPVKAWKALRAGLVDSIVDDDKLLEKAKAMALSMAQGPGARRKTLQLTKK